jgi:ElaB/YqjD/DUF883 family membrane-anchored ribosome-binding protein
MNHDLGNLGNTEAASRAANLSKKAGRVAEDLKDLGHEALGTVEDAIKEIKAVGGGAVESARQRGGEALEKGRDRVESARADFEDYVAEHPSTAIMVAAAIGAFIGFTVRGRL